MVIEWEIEHLIRGRWHIASQKKILFVSFFYKTVEVNIGAGN